MQLHEVEEIRACLPQGRTLFRYGKDRCALELLKLALRGETAVPALKHTAFGRLLEKPSVRRWIGSLGKTTVSPGDLDLLWPEEVECFRLTLDVFDGWAQTSRRGRLRWNLVLQLNLNSHDARMIEGHLGAGASDPFEWSCHPIHEGRHRTLAWARIDLDWNSGEALIEEVQNDRLREVRDWVDHIRSRRLDRVRIHGVEWPAAFLLEYWNVRLRLARAVWDEAITCAAIRLIVGELGIRRIWFHTPESGRLYKSIAGSGPPRSVYTDLPRKFCFRPVSERPAFLQKARRRANDVGFQLLEI